MTTTLKPHEVRAELNRRFPELYPAWCRGEPDVECLHDGTVKKYLYFDADPSHYTFRRVPPPEPKRVLRPWTAAELWEHRDWWFRRKTDGKTYYRVVGVGSDCLGFAWLSRMDSEDLKLHMECRPPHAAYNDPWQPCGVWVDEGSVK